MDKVEAASECLRKIQILKSTLKITQVERDAGKIEVLIGNSLILQTKDKLEAEQMYAALTSSLAVVIAEFEEHCTEQAVKLLETEDAV